MPEEQKPYEPLWHQSGVNGQGEPFVQLILGEKVIAQLDPEMARDHARAILEATEAAEQDAFMLQFFTKIGLPLEQVGMLIVDFRTWRKERGKSAGPTSGREFVQPEKRDGN